MHYVGMSAIRVQASLTYSPVLVAASVVIAVIAGTAALCAALRLDTLWSTVVASLIMGIAISGMHYTGMAALRVAAAPSLVVSTSATASTEAFLLPLILGLSSVGFIFSAVVSLSPTAAEILEEDELMKRIGRAPGYEPQARPGAAPDGSGPERPAQPESLFRPHQAARRSEDESLSEADYASAAALTAERRGCRRGAADSRHLNTLRIAVRCSGV